MDIKCMRREAAAAIIRFEKKAASLSQFLSMIRLKKVYVELVREVVESEGDHHEDGR